jgi:hypothetical protein
MVLQSAYVVARNASGRPTLQHKLLDGGTALTLCGRNVSAWSCAYMHKKIDAIICRRCAG